MQNCLLCRYYTSVLCRCHIGLFISLLEPNYCPLAPKQTQTDDNTDTDSKRTVIAGTLWEGENWAQFQADTQVRGNCRWFTVRLVTLYSDNYSFPKVRARSLTWTWTASHPHNAHVTGQRSRMCTQSGQVLLVLSFVSWWRRQKVDVLREGLSWVRSAQCVDSLDCLSGFNFMMHINLQVPRLAFACKSFESSVFLAQVGGFFLLHSS